MKNIRWKLTLALIVGALMSTTLLHLFARASFNPASTMVQNQLGGEWIPETFIGSFTAIDMISADDGWLVADRGRFYHWDGNTWSLAASVGTTVDINAIDMTSSSSGWAVGKDKNTTDSQGTAGIWRFQDGTWSAVVAPDIGSPLLDIDMVSETEGWAVSEYGAILYYDGMIWEEFASVWGSDTRGVKMLSSMAGWIVGYDTVLRFDGAKWVRESDGEWGSIEFSDVGSSPRMI